MVYVREWCSGDGEKQDVWGRVSEIQVDYVDGVECEGSDFF